MRRIVLLLASVGLALLLTSGVVIAQESDTTPPETTIHEWNRPAPYEGRLSSTFGFSSNEENSTFECKLDNGSFEACTSPKVYYLLQEGQHTFAVRAKDAAGNVDQTPDKYMWEIDRTDPKMTWTERPGRKVGGYAEWITKDTTPTWAYEFSDKNLKNSDPTCELYSTTWSRYILSWQPCPSPLTPPFELPDGYYYFEVGHRDEADNGVKYGQSLEVDTVAPKFVSGKPTGKRVSRSSKVIASFDDNVYNSAKSVNIYKKGSSTPLAASRSNDGKKITLYPKKALKGGTWYTVKVTTGVNDGANNLEAPKTWNFKTRG